jgi:cytidylate kinase
MAEVKIPVITIDGPGGTGKGTLSHLLAQKLQWHFLDSGVLYRALALAALKYAVNIDSASGLAKLAAAIDLRFQGGNVLLAGEIMTDALRTSECGQIASKISAYPSVREALLDKQRAFRQLPGLVTDGRDMGTVVFPDADVKIYLDASLEARAKRRFIQLQEKGINVSLERVLAELSERDKRDQERATAPLKPAEDAWYLDTTALSAEEVFDRVYQKVSHFL